MRLRRLFGTVLLATAVLAGACGGGDDGGKAASSSSKAAAKPGKGTPLEVVTAANKNMIDAGSSRFTMLMETESQGQKIKLTADGLFDYKSGEGKLTMDLSSLGIPGASGTLEMLMMGKIFYMKMPGLAEQLGQPGKEWMKVDSEKSSGMDLTGMGAMGGNDPTAMFDLMRGATDDLEELGVEQVRGDKTTHYKGTFDLKKAMEKAPAESKKALESSMTALGTENVPMDVWIDDDGRLRKMVMTITVPEAGASTITMELFDFGVDIDVEAPPADSVADITQMMTTTVPKG